jgi:hypothetical protein
MEFMGKFSLTCGGCAVRDEKSTTNMVNADAVNVRARHFLHATFCVIFRDSGRILDSWNPVKYGDKLKINGLMPSTVALGATAKPKRCSNINLLRHGFARLTLS